mmetsp:Transcript_84383/g.214808  ORF Transcript_84383/g.214808 Transcript_84383/m.214808 type:complete len:214 (+) Transcript_84383:425-1066(+)
MVLPISQVAVGVQSVLPTQSSLEDKIVTDGHLVPIVDLKRDLRGATTHLDDADRLRLGSAGRRVEGALKEVRGNPSEATLFLAPDDIGPLLPEAVPRRQQRRPHALQDSARLLRSDRPEAGRRLEHHRRGSSLSLGHELVGKRQQLPDVPLGALEVAPLREAGETGLHLQSLRTSNREVDSGNMHPVNVRRGQHIEEVYPRSTAPGIEHQDLV